MIAPNYGNTGINPHQPGPLAPTSERDLILSLTGPPTPNPLTTPAASRLCAELAGQGADLPDPDSAAAHWQ